MHGDPRQPPAEQDRVEIRLLSEEKPTMHGKQQIHAPRSNSGAELNRRWNVGATQSRYHKDGTFFMPVDKFPAAFFDPNGYLIFPTLNEYDECPHFRIGKRVNVPCGISSVPGYIRRPHQT